MLVHCLLCARGSIGYELRNRHGAEKGFVSQDNLCSHKALPAGAGSFVGVEVVWQGEGKVVVCHQCGDTSVEVGDELFSSFELRDLVKLLLEVGLE